MPEREENERGREDMAFISDSGRKIYLKPKHSLKKKKSVCNSLHWVRRGALSSKAYS